MVYIFLAEGFEEIEAITTHDILLRAGVEVKTVGIGTKYIEGAHGIKIECDMCEKKASTDDDITAIVLPGGMPGTTNLKESEVVNHFIDFANENNLLIAAICAAPSVLGAKNLLNGKSATCYPGFESELLGAKCEDKPICIDGNIITGKGPGVTIDFALELVKYLVDDKTALDIKESMQCQ